MFNKSKPNDYGAQGLGIPPAPEHTPIRPAEQARPLGRSSNLSTLAAGVNYEGNISGAGELQVEGSLKGDVRVARVIIGEGGTVEGTVHADELDVRGRITGAIVAKQVKLFATARIEGDITQEQLAIEQGAWFQGRCNQAKRDTGAVLLEAPAEKKADKAEAKSKS